MLNQVVMVGRLANDLEVKSVNEKQIATMTLAVPRSYKNEKGEYDTDFINITLWNAVAQNTGQYCKKGDVIGVKGRLQSNKNKIEFIAEKVTFLSSKKTEEE